MKKNCAAKVYLTQRRKDAKTQSFLELEQIQIQYMERKAETRA